MNDTNDTLAGLMERRGFSKADGLKSIEWLDHGSRSNGIPGTLWKATTKTGDKFRFFEVFTPAPRNNRNACRALLAAFLRGHSLKLEGATVIEVGS